MQIMTSVGGGGRLKARVVRGGDGAHHLRQKGPAGVGSLLPGRPVAPIRTRAAVRTAPWDLKVGGEEALERDWGKPRRPAPPREANGGLQEQQHSSDGICSTAERPAPPTKPEPVVKREKTKWKASQRSRRTPGGAGRGTGNIERRSGIAKRSERQKAPSRARVIALKLAEIPRGSDIGAVLKEYGQLSAKDVTKLIKQLDQMQMPLLAGATVRWLETNGDPSSLDLFVYSKLMASLAKTPQTSRRALIIFTDLEAKDLELDTWCYNAAIAAAAQLKDLELGFRLLQRMEDSSIQPDVGTYTTLIKVCQSCGDVEAALGVLADMRSAAVEPNVRTYTTIISLLTREGQWQQAMDIFEEMQAEGILADLRAYNALITACAAAGLWEQARQVLAAMRDSGVQPDVRSYNAVLSSLRQSGQCDWALRVFQNMKAMAAKGESEVEPDLVTYNTLMASLAQEGRLEEVLALYSEMPSRGLQADNATCTALMVACGRCKDLEEAMRLFGELQAQGLKLNTINYNALLGACSSALEVDKAVEVFEGMQVLGSDTAADVVSYSTLITCLERSGDWKQAIRRYDEMREAGIEPNTYIFNAVLTACERGRQWGKALEVCDIMAGVGDIGAIDALMRRFIPTLGPLAEAAQAALYSGKAARRWIDSGNAAESGWPEQ